MSVCVYTHWERERLKEGRESFAILCSLCTNWIVGPLALLSEKAPLKTSVLASLTLSSSSSLGIQSPCLSPLDWSVMLCPHSFSDSKGSEFFSAWPSRTSNTLAQALPPFWCPWLGLRLNHCYHAPSSSALTFPLLYSSVIALRCPGYCITLVPRV